MIRLGTPLMISQENPGSSKTVLNANSNYTHIAKHYIGQWGSTRRSISHTNKSLQRRIREKNFWFFSLTQSAMDKFPATLLNRKTLKRTHTHTHTHTNTHTHTHMHRPTSRMQHWLGEWQWDQWLTWWSNLGEHFSLDFWLVSSLWSGTSSFLWVLYDK